MDIRKVKKLIELLDESGIAEIEITEGEESVRISRYPPGTVAAPAVAAPLIAAAAPAATAAPAPAPKAAPGETPAVDLEDDGFLVIAPMVGTFYASSSPGAAAYVQVGDRIKPFTLRMADGTTLTSNDLLSRNRPTFLFFFKRG